MESQITIESRVKSLEVSTQYSQKAMDRIEKSIDHLACNIQKSIDHLACNTQKSIDQLADHTQKSVDHLDQSIQHVRQDFDRKFCWLYGLQISTILTLAGILAKMANIY